MTSISYQTKFNAAVLGKQGARICGIRIPRKQARIGKAPGFGICMKARECGEES
jgi:hypothetical protein